MQQYSDIYKVFATPIVGVLTFTIFINILPPEHLAKNLPIYQSFNAIYAVIGLSFYYVDRREKTAYPLILILSIINLFIFLLLKYFSLISADLSFILVSTFIYGSFQVTNYYYIFNRIKDRFIEINLIFSLFIPATLSCGLFYWLDLIWLATSLCIILYIIFILRSKFDKISDFNINYTQPVNAALSQCIFLAFPIFDIFTSQSLIRGEYSQYLLIYKYIYGIICFIFSYKQMKILFEEAILYQESNSARLLNILLFILCLPATFNSSPLIISLSILSISIMINTTSISVRKRLVDGKLRLEYLSSPFFLVIYGVYCFIAYYLFKFENFSFLTVLGASLLCFNLIDFHIILKMLRSLIPSFRDYNN